MVGCGGTYVNSWAIAEAYNLELDQNHAYLYDDWNASQFKTLEMIFENLHVNDYEELIELNDLDEDTVTEYTIINELAKDEITAYDEPLKISVAGKKYEFENVLVGSGTLYDNIRSTSLKIRINAYYDYYTRNAVEDLEIASLEPPETDWLSQWNQLFLSWFNTFPMLILGIVLLLILIVFVKRGFSERSG